MTKSPKKSFKIAFDDGRALINYLSSEEILRFYRDFLTNAFWGLWWTISIRYNSNLEIFPLSQKNHYHTQLLFSQNNQFIIPTSFSTTIQSSNNQIKKKNTTMTVNNDKSHLIIHFLHKQLENHPERSHPYFWSDLLRDFLKLWSEAKNFRHSCKHDLKHWCWIENHILF